MKVSKTIFILILFLAFKTSLVFGVPNEGYGEDSQALGQFVDTYENLDNVTVFVDLIRNSTLDAIEVDGIEYIEYIEAPFQLREHDRWDGYEPSTSWALGTSLNAYTNTGPRGDSWMFFNMNAQWLQGKYVRLNWHTVGSYVNADPLYFRVYDGSYERSSATDFPEDNPMLLKGSGLLYQYREPNFNTWTTREFYIDLDTWGHELDTVMVAIYLDDSYFNGYVRNYLAWFEVNSGSGGAGNIYTVDCEIASETLVSEVSGTDHDQSRLDDIGLPLTGGGYYEGGYLITDNYLNYTTGSSLLLLTNTSISENVNITVQFSNDNSTWVDNEGNMGSTEVLNGFHAIDLRDLNYTDIHIMYNLSATLTETPILYQSRLVTTIGNVTGGNGDPVVGGGINSATIIMLIFLCGLAITLLWRYG